MKRMTWLKGALALSVLSAASWAMAADHIDAPGAIADPPTLPSRPPSKVFEYGGLMPMRSTTLPGRMSLNSPNPVRSTVFGVICQANAVRGCKMASGVAAKTLLRLVRIASFRGWLMS